jgi:hypothetical protein
METASNFMKPVLQLARTVARNLQVPVDGPYQITNIMDWLNRRYEKIWNYAMWPDTLDLYTINIPPTTPRIVLPKFIDRILGIIEDDKFTTVTAPTKFDLYALVVQFYKSPGTDFAPLAKTPVILQPTKGATLTITSTDPADNAKSITVEGLNADAAAAMIVNIGTSFVNPFDSITAIGKAATKGIVNVAMGNVAIASLGPNETTSIYPIYIQAQVGQQNQNPHTLLTVIKKRWTPFLANTSATAWELDNALIAGATADGWREHRNQSMSAEFEAKYADEMGEAMSREFGSQVSIFAPVGRY